MNYFKILYIIDKHNKGLFDIPVEEQKRYLSQFPEPKDDIERSYCQYKCQMLFSPWWLKALWNVAAMLVFPIVMLLFLLKKSPVSIRRCETVVCVDKKLSDVVPREISGTKVCITEGSCFRFYDVCFCLKIALRYFHAPYFCLKLLFKITQYRHLIEKYHPSQIAYNTEFSFGSSAMTAYCNSLGIQHINYMHGEKLYYIRDSFFRFDKCYVWDEHYANLFRMLRAEPTQFVISQPTSLVFDKDKYVIPELHVDYKYYLAAQTKKELREIVDVMKQLQDRGFSIMLRPHPRYTDMPLLQSLIDKKNIENVKAINIETSIASTDNVISGFSTVLHQAYYAGKCIIIDDLVYPEKYKQLYYMQYIMTQKKHIRLSQII